METLTLIVPNLNGSRYIEAALASICAQGSNACWWLQDAESTDNSVAIARKFKRTCDTIVVEKDAGQADGINRGLQKVDAEYLGYLNSDDCLKPRAAEKVLQAFRENPGADIVYGGVEIIDSDSNVMRVHSGAIDSFPEVMDIYRYWWRHKQLVQPEVFFRKRLFRKLGGFDNRYHLAFDFDFWLRAFASGARSVRLPEVLAQFRIHENQKSTNAGKAAEEIRDSVTRHLHLLPWQRRVRIGARLSYDRFRGTGAKLSPGSFLEHPNWVLVPEVWHRVFRSVAARAGQKRGGGE